MTDTISTRTRIGIRRLAGHIGAEITGADAGTELGDDTIAQVRQALLDHKVVFLRDQSLDYAGQPSDSKYTGQQWHSDLSFTPVPSLGSLLRGITIPPVGGDTIWANTVTAYQSLPAELRDLADRLRIVHTNDHDYAAVYGRGERVDPATEAAQREFLSTVYETEHPAVRVHPETAEPSLVLGGFARTVLGFSPQASRDLIRILQEYVTRPEQTLRWRWREGDLAIWDNRATQHYAIFDYGNAHRRGERVTVAGPVPVGVDGRPSVPLKGDASTYYAGAN